MQGSAAAVCLGRTSGSSARTGAGAGGCGGRLHMGNLAGVSLGIGMWGAMRPACQVSSLV